MCETATSCKPNTRAFRQTETASIMFVSLCIDVIFSLIYPLHLSASGAPTGRRRHLVEWYGRKRSGASSLLTCPFFITGWTNFPESPWNCFSLSRLLFAVRHMLSGFGLSFHASQRRCRTAWPSLGPYGMFVQPSYNFTITVAQITYNCIDY